MKRTLKIAVLLCLAIVVMLMMAACYKTPDKEFEQTMPQQTTPEHVHNFGDWTLVAYPEPDKTGEALRVCACGEKETQTIPKIGSAGLAYQINEDGKTCTITGRGTCTDAELVIPVAIDGYLVTEIGGLAFRGSQALKSVTILNNVIRIQTMAFENCSNLTSVTIPDSVTNIDAFAFQGCDKLIQIENGVSYVDKWVIGCDRSVTSVVLRANTVGIVDYAFFNCSVLTSVTIPNSVTSVASRAFPKCDNLIQIKNGVSYVDKWVVGCDTSVTSVVLQENTAGIGDRAFYGCNSLMSVTIPDSVTIIGDEAFHDCCNLTSVTIPDSVIAIGDEAFRACLNLASVTIGNSVTSIGDNAFFDCYNLTSVTIPDSVTSVGNMAFYSCFDLTSVTVGNSVARIGNHAFDGCYKLVEVINKSSMNITAESSDYGYIAYNAKEVHSGTTKIVNLNDYLFYTYNGTNYLIVYVGTDTVLNLPENYCGENYEIYLAAFRSCYDLTSVIIPDSVTTIGGVAFSNCTNLTSVMIPDSVTSIGNDAFSNCTNLTSVTIPDSVTIIGDRAFSDCTSLTSIIFEGPVAQWNTINKDIHWYNIVPATEVICSDGVVELK